ncbi:cytochrome P450 alkane hydroxylase protein [Rutstroemia sp. NJR-2017a BVV2]|nr:cytochrome P450 alkane hydroxylase protein [Rutstroemia sp. NJR-2017a BVV2]
MAPITYFEEYSLSTIILFLVGSTYIFYSLIQRIALYRQRSQVIRQNGCKPYAKYPHKEPFLGLDLFYLNIGYSRARKFLEHSCKRYHAHGNTYATNFFGDNNIHTIEPENIKTVLSVRFKDFEFSPRRVNALAPIFGKGIFTTDGKEWEHSRTMLRPNFTRSQVADLDVFESHIKKMIKRIPTNGETVDLSVLFFMLTIDSATEFLFGQSTDVLDDGTANKMGERFSDAFTYVSHPFGLRVPVLIIVGYGASWQGRTSVCPVGKLAVLFPNKKYREDVQYIHNYVRVFVDKALALRKDGSLDSSEKEERYTFLAELAKNGCSAKTIQDELLNILLAGRDTTASLLTILWWILSRRKDVFEKLRAEVMQLGSERPTFEKIKDMKYLRYCMNETIKSFRRSMLTQTALRLYPIVPANGRQAARDTVLPVGGGPDGKSPIFVKKGDMVIYSSWALHRRKDFYGEDADEFRPERWEDLRVGWQYLPFNGGPRICIGQQFALTEASYTTIRLLQAFKDIESRDDNPFEEMLTLTLSNLHGAKVGLTPA